MSETTEMCVRCGSEAIGVASFCTECIDDLGNEEGEVSG